MINSSCESESILTTLTSRVSIPDGVLFQDLDGEAVLLNQENGKYYGLDQTGTRMWNSLIEHSQVGASYRALLEVYDVAEKQLEGDLLRFVDQLAAQGLLEVDDG